MTTGLTMLKLWGVTLQPSHAQQDSALGASHLLQLLARQTALRELLLINIEGDWPQQLAPYAALTASSSLQELSVEYCDFEGAVWPHVFPAGRKLPQLRVFRGGAPAAPFGSAGITRLASCCPAVEELTLTPAADASLAPLRSLTALTSLHVGSVSLAPIHSDLAALSQLRSLHVSRSLPAVGVGEDKPSWLQHLVPLTALTCLTSFSSQCHGDCMGLSSKVSNQAHCPLSGILGLHAAVSSTANPLCCYQARQQLLRSCVLRLRAHAGPCRIRS
jgi:hypothetical protein